MINISIVEITLVSLTLISFIFFSYLSGRTEIMTFINDVTPFGVGISAFLFSVIFTNLLVPREMMCLRLIVFLILGLMCFPIFIYFEDLGNEAIYPEQGE